ncbi:MAG: sulfite exporter TauE/SafE family protein [Patescibacteria group bacterium]
MSHKLVISIAGLHCRACELLNEKNLGRLPGVTKVLVDHRSGRAEIYHQGEAPDKEAIRRILKADGYDLADEAGLSGTDGTGLNCAPDAGQRGRTNWQLLIPLLALAYWLVSRLHFGDASGLIRGEFSLPLAVLVGLVAGISTCLALVGGLVLGVAANYAKENPDASRIQKFQPHIIFNAGRVLGFFFLGGLLGLLGSAFQISPFFNGLLTILVGAVVLVLGLKLLDIAPALNRIDFALPKSWGRRIKADNPLLLGALTFFLPCGFTQAMQIYALGSGSFLNGGLIMAFFALGTAPGLLSIGGLSSLLDQKKSRLFFRAAGVVVVLFAMFNLNNGWALIKVSGFGAGNIINGGPTGDATIPNSGAIDSAAADEGVQIVRMVESNRGYAPNSFTVVKNKPVRWIIDAQAPYSCASSLIVPSLGIRRQLKPGENVIEFTPTKSGDLPFSCSMGMYTGNFLVLED